jgi:hypothetical protein
MFSVRKKREIADKVQQILRETNHPELPAGEIDFHSEIPDDLLQIDREIPRRLIDGQMLAAICRLGYWQDRLGLSKPSQQGCARSMSSVGG